MAKWGKRVTATGMIAAGLARPVPQEPQTPVQQQQVVTNVTVSTPAPDFVLTAEQEKELAAKPEYAFLKTEPVDQKALDWALIDACEKGNLPDVAFLVKKGANPNVRYKWYTHNIVGDDGNLKEEEVTEREYEISQDWQSKNDAAEKSKEAARKAAMRLYYLAHDELPEQDAPEEVSSNDNSDNCCVEYNESTPLRGAIQNGHKDIVRFLLEHGISRETMSGEMEFLDVDMARIFLQHGADPNYMDNEGHRSPFQAAVEYGKFDLARVYLEEGKADANLPTQGDFLQYPIELVNVVYQGNALESFELLKAHGADLFIDTTEDGTLLHKAVTKIQPRLVEYLLDAGLNANAHWLYTNEDGVKNDLPMAFVWAQANQLSQSAVKTLSLLKEHGMNVDDVNDKGETALQWAAAGLYEPTAELLYLNGADPKRARKAIEKQLTALEKQADTLPEDNLPDIEGQLLRMTLGPLKDMVDQDSMDTDPTNKAILERIEGIKRKLSPSEVRSDFIEKQTVLQDALNFLDTLTPDRLPELAKKYSVEMEQAEPASQDPAPQPEFPRPPSQDRMLFDLVIQGKLTELQDKTRENPEQIHSVYQIEHADNWSLLHGVASYGILDGQIEMAQWLLDQKLPINARTFYEDTPGNTPLIEAIKTQNVPMVEFLLARGASPEIRNELMGWTALHFAADAGNKKIVDLLIRAGADLHAHERNAPDGRTPLDIAQSKLTRGKGFFDIAQELSAAEKGSSAKTAPSRP